MNTDFKFQETKLKNAFIIEPFYSEDERGAFLKDYNINKFIENGINHELKEVFYTISHKGVIRAIHFQLEHQQAKLVRCVKGKIYDVIVDLQKDSDTFGKWYGCELSEFNHKMLYVPQYFGHGYLVLEEAVVSYKCGEVFYREGDSGIIFNDPTLNIKWPFDRIEGIQNLIISEKDKSLMSFKEYCKMII